MIRNPRALAVVVAVMVANLLPQWAQAAAPTYVLKSPAAIEGLFIVGQTLNIDFADPDTEVSYQWFADGNAIGGATNQTFTLTASQNLKDITARITVSSDGFGDAVVDLLSGATVRTSDFTTSSSTTIDGVKTYEPYCLQPEATGTDVPTIGWNLFLSCQYYNTSLGIPTDTNFKWYRNAAVVEGATKSSYNLSVEDEGASISGLLRTQWSSGVVYQSLTRTLEIIPAEAKIETITISGQLVEGQTLTTSVTGADVEAELTYQWYRDFEMIAGANDSTYEVQSEDVGSRIQVMVIAAVEGETTASRLSAPLGRPISDPAVSKAVYQSIYKSYTSTETDYDISYITSPGISTEALLREQDLLQKIADFWREDFTPSDVEVMYVTENDGVWANNWVSTNHPTWNLNIANWITSTDCHIAVANRIDDTLFFFQCVHSTRPYDIDQQQIGPHEYSHWMQYKFSPNNWLPATPWMIEGQANFYGLAIGIAPEDPTLDSINQSLAQHALDFDNYTQSAWSAQSMLQMMKSGNLLDIETLITRNGAVRDSYIIGTLISEYLVSKYGHDLYWEWVSGILAGKEATDDNGRELTATLFESIFGFEFADLPAQIAPYFAMRATEIETRWIDIITPDLPPERPTSITAVASNGSVTVTWVDGSDNGNEVTEYRVYWSGGSKTCESSPCVITGLTNGTTYSFTVSAFNAIGESNRSDASANVKPMTVPTVPRSVVATRGNGRATVSWLAPANLGGSAITHYLVDVNGSTVQCSASPCQILNLRNGTAISFKVRAVNAAGQSDWSALTSLVTPAGPPGASTSLTGKSTAVKKMTLSWVSASANGSAVLKYEYSWKLSSAKSYSSWKSVGTKTTAVVTGWLKGKTYQVKIRATNAVGSSISKVFTVKPTK